MSLIAPVSFSIDSTIDLTADQYSALLASSQLFRAASDADSVVLESGFTDPSTSTDYNVERLVGNVDEYELRFTPNRMEASIRGRDLAWQLIAKPFRRLYSVSALTQAAKDALVAKGYTFREGQFRASQIAREVCDFVGLNLAWSVRDYTFFEDFDASGPPVEVLKALIDPWNQVPQLRVFMFVEGSTLIIRQVQQALAAEFVFDVAAARLKSLTVRKRRSQFYGRVKLEGRKVPKGLTEQVGPGGAIVHSSTEVDETKTIKTFDASGNVLTEVVRTDTYRMPDKLLLRSVEATYGRTPQGQFDLIKEERKANIWEESVYDATGPRNQPRQLEQHAVIQGIHENDPKKTFQVIKSEDVAYGYEQSGFLSVTTTKRYDLNLQKNVMEQSEEIVKTLQEVEHLKLQEVTTRWVIEDGKLVLKSVDTQVSAGLAPGGTRPPRSIVAGAVSQTASSKEPLRLEEVISTDERAKDMAYANGNLTADDLAHIMSQFRTGSGKWEHELAMSQVPMPWLRKGHVFQLVNLADPDGNAIGLAPALVTQITLNQGTTEVLASVRAMYWSAT